MRDHARCVVVVFGNRGKRDKLRYMCRAGGNVGVHPPKSVVCIMDSFVKGYLSF